MASNGYFLFFFYLELIHDLANAFATGPDDAGMDSAVEGDVLRNHLLKLIHDGLDGIPCCNGILFVTSDGDLILEARQQMNDQLWPSLRASVKRHQMSK